MMPLIVRYITNEVVYFEGQKALETILILGATHEELLEKRGAYEALYNLQFR